VLALAGCAGGPQGAPPPIPPQPSPTVGVLVMAHGGTLQWDADVRDAVASLGTEVPVEIAFGMADRASLQGAVAGLEARGVERIAVVRLFISRRSFLHQTEYLLGLRPDAPARFVGHAGHGDRSPPAVVRRRADVRVSRHGLAESPIIGTILRQRVAALSRDPRAESVLVVGHGAGDDEENAEVLGALDAALDSIRAAGPFRAVMGETLREDWPEKRAEAEQRIRQFVADGAAGGQVLVVPFRLSGFGPYGRVLAGLTYRADSTGLLPHPRLTRWIRDAAAEEICGAGWGGAPRECRAVAR